MHSIINRHLKVLSLLSYGVGFFFSKKFPIKRQCDGNNGANIVWANEIFSSHSIYDLPDLAFCFLGLSSKKTKANVRLIFVKLQFAPVWATATLFVRGWRCVFRVFVRVYDWSM